MMMMMMIIKFTFSSYHQDLQKSYSPYQARRIDRLLNDRPNDPD